MIIGGSASQDLASKVAEELDERLCYVESKKFPDGERYHRIIGDIDDEVIIIQSISYPQDENIIELLFLISTVKDLGAKKVKVVVPYLGYARQEKSFKDGEVVSAKVVCNLIESVGADEFISINLHEDSVLDFFNIKSSNISAMPAIAEYIDYNIDDKPIIVAPDKGAYPFALEIAKILDGNCLHFSKVRLGPDEVVTKFKDMDYDDNYWITIDKVKGKNVFIIDDIIATGGTIVNAVNLLKEHNPESVDVCCVHPILSNAAVSRIYSAGAKSIFSTNSISSDTTRVSLAKTIANELK